jgi:WD40-like Beta Propeller Repeat
MLMLRRVLVVLAGLLVVVGLGAPAGALGAEGAGCPNEQLRVEQHEAGLPDCRAYELVSPLEKNDQSASPFDGRAAVSGEAVTYLSTGIFAESKSAPALESRYISRRTSGGWSTESIMPPSYNLVKSSALYIPFQELLFTPDLSKGLLASKYYTPLVGGEPEGYINVYLADTETGSYQTVSNATPPETEIKPYGENAYGSESPQPQGGSTDLSSVVFSEGFSLCCGASPETHHLYEWSGSRLGLVDVAPGGGNFNKGDFATFGASAVYGNSQFYGNPWHAVSADGSRVFFTEEQEGKTAQLYVRENPLSPVEDCSVQGDACTVEVSASQRDNAQGEPEADPHGPRTAFYRDASADGSRVFFTSRAELTSDAFTGPEDNAANLYEYNLNTGVLSDLTVDKTDPDGAAVVGLATAGEDGSYIYFVANGVLSEAANSQGAKAGPGDCKEEAGEVVGERTCSLYVEHYNGTAWEAPRFIATLAGSSTQEFVIEGGSVNVDEDDWVGYENRSADFGPGTHSVRVTPDGKTLVFQSERSLTGYDNEPAEAGECGASVGGGLGCREVYLYSAGSGGLVCVSCHAGARPTGSSGIDRMSGADTREGVLKWANLSDTYVPRNLSEDGRHLFFESSDALVASDGNGLTDVYEWDLPVAVPGPEDSCTRSSPGFVEAAGGCVFAISDVAGDHESHFMDASASGDDVFIGTSDHLLALTDGDPLANVYDVRVGGGFPVSEEVLPECTSADSCRPPASLQPAIFGNVSSETFSGPGNAVPPPPSPAAIVKPRRKTVKCKKNQRLSHGRCTKKTSGKKPRNAKKATGRVG